MRRLPLIAALAAAALAAFLLPARADQAIEAYIYGQSAASAPYGSGLRIPAAPSASASSLVYIPANLLATLSDTQTLTNKTLDCNNNTCTNFPAGNTGLSGMTAGQVPLAATATTITSSFALGTGVQTFLTTPTSANLRAALTDETGTGIAYFVGGALGTPSSATLTNATGLPTAGLNAAAVTYAKIQNGASAGLLGVNNGSAPTEVAVGSGLSLSAGTLSATGGGATTGTGVDGGASAQSLTGTTTISNGTRLVKAASGWATGTLTLPAISAVSADTCIRIEDGGNFIDGTHTLTLKGGVADGLNGGAANGTIGPFTVPGTFLLACVSAANNWNVGPGSVGAQAATSNNFLTGIDATGLFTRAQPAFSNLSGTATAAQLPATPLVAGGNASLTGPREYYVCTGTCTVTPPVPVPGYEFCVMNDDNVATVITLAALGSSARYEATARTSYGTAGTGTFVSGGAAADKVCLVGRDSTHYLTTSFSGSWTAN